MNATQMQSYGSKTDAIPGRDFIGDQPHIQNCSRVLRGPHHMQYNLPNSAWGNVTLGTSVGMYCDTIAGLMKCYYIEWG
jgi:hypothetical protein